jgi:hypothetical protein
VSSVVGVEDWKEMGSDGGGGKGLDVDVDMVGYIGGLVVSCWMPWEMIHVRMVVDRSSSCIGKSQCLF